MKNNINLEETKITWSLEYDGNSYNDDYFTGTFEECAAEAKAMELEPEEFQIAKIEINNDGCVIFTHDLVKGTEID